MKSEPRTGNPEPCSIPPNRRRVMHSTPAKYAPGVTLPHRGAPHGAPLLKLADRMIHRARTHARFGRWWMRQAHRSADSLSALECGGSTPLSIPTDHGQLPTTYFDRIMKNRKAPITNTPIATNPTLGHAMLCLETTTTALVVAMMFVIFSRPLFTSGEFRTSSGNPSPTQSQATRASAKLGTSSLAIGTSFVICGRTLVPWSLVIGTSLVIGAWSLVIRPATSVSFHPNHPNRLEVPSCQVS